MENKDGLIEALIEMYVDTLDSLLTGSGEENAKWGKELVDEGSPDESIKYTELFNEVLPHYLAIGMTIDEFWNVRSLVDCHTYRKAWDIKRHNENFRAWLHNKYTMDAIACALPRGSKQAPYPEEPYPLTKEDMARVQRRKIEERAKYLRAQAESSKRKKEARENGNN